MRTVAPSNDCGFDSSSASGTLRALLNSAPNKSLPFASGFGGVSMRAGGSASGAGLGASFSEFVDAPRDAACREGSTVELDVWGGASGGSGVASCFASRVWQAMAAAQAKPKKVGFMR